MQAKYYTVKNNNQEIKVSNTAEALKKDILQNLYFIQGRTPELASLHDWYMSVSFTLRNRLMKNWIDALEHYKTKDIKIVGYLSAEFLMGPHLGNAIINLDIYNQVKEALEMLDLNIYEVLNKEGEPGLGNGGLGRLAACYLDSMSTLNVPAIGYGIRYEFGIFEQQIVNGQQVETTDKWLQNGNPWEIIQTNINYKVKFGGYTKSHVDEHGKYCVDWIADKEVKGIAYDTPVPGYKNNAINLLRLWKAEAYESFDFSEFNHGNYAIAVDKKTWAETLTKVLYPNDDMEAGKKLRLMQQYFFVTCSLQNVIGIQLQRGKKLHELPGTFALQLNDTHPSIAIAEMMRLLVDEHNMWWPDAWHITQQTFGYTNHTLLPEALEKWPLDLFQSILPRHLEIIYQINQSFLDEVAAKFPGNDSLLQRISIIDESGAKAIRMAHLAAVGSHRINGVSQLHTRLLEQDVLKDFYALNPDKFINVTNGVTPRRWMKLYNPKLADLITKNIGNDWITNIENELLKLENLADNAAFQKNWQQIKQENKITLADKLMKLTGIAINPESLYDVQVKRMHEYKRQHLCVLHIITLYNRIKKNPSAHIVPRTFIFGGKAAPGYVFAKLVIRLINAVAEKVNNDADVAGRMKVVFYPNYSVKNSEWVYRAADLSEQISTAGKEASGTGNMKFGLNGALTIGTLDGANVEMREAVGAENFFLFGLTADQVYGLKSNGYNPMNYYNSNAELKDTIDLLASGFFADGDASVFNPITDSLLQHDPYLLMADYASYIACQDKVSEAYQNQTAWTRKSILNVARLGYFSSDRSIREYCEKVWNVKIDSPLNLQLSQ